MATRGIERCLAMTPDILSACTGCTLLTAGRFSAPLTAAMARWGIDTPLRQAAFLAQVSHESGRLTTLSENLNYSAQRLCAVWPSRFPSPASAQPFANNPQALANKVYGGRMGNTAPDDGWRYRGRGLKQLTGKSNYTAYQQASGKPVLAQPDLLLEPDAASDSAAWFWHANGCNALADRQDWKALTARINGGTLGLAERVALTQRAMKTLGVS